MSEQTIEQQIKDKQLNAPRLTPAIIDGLIVSEHYHIFEGTTTTVCCLVLQNGYTVVGKSACVSQANFDEQIGRDIARENARREIWDVAGYALREQLAKNPVAIVVEANRVVENHQMISRYIVQPPPNVTLDIGTELFRG